MRPVSDQWATTVRTSHPVTSNVEAWLNGAPGRTVPITGGQITYDLSAREQRRVTMTVPLYGPDGFRWDPGADPTHPLATNGQRLKISVGVLHPDRTPELMNQGFYLISSVTTNEEDGLITVQGSDLMQLMTESKIFLASDSVYPLPTDTHLTAIDKLMWPALHSPSLNDVKILPTAFDTLPIFTIGGTVSIRDGADRMEHIDRITASWPARSYVDDEGRLHFALPIEEAKPVPDVRITADRTTSTLTGHGHTQDRRRPYNAVKVLGQSSTDGQILGQARAFKQTGPLSVRGPYGWVTRWYQSDMISSNAHAAQVAATLLREGLLLGRTEQVTCVPDPAIELGDTVAVTTTATGTFTGLCTSITLPLTSSGGAMTLDVTNMPDDATMHIDTGTR